MRLIDADALKKYKFTTKIANGVELEDIEVVPVPSIDNAPTVDITEEQAIDKLHETGWLPKHDKEMTERPCSNCQEFDCHGCDHFCKEEKNDT